MHLFEIATLKFFIDDVFFAAIFERASFHWQLDHALGLLTRKENEFYWSGN